MENFQAYIDGKLSFEEPTLQDVAMKAAEVWYTHWEEYGGFGEVDKLVHEENDSITDLSPEAVKKLNAMILDELEQIRNEDR